MTKHPDNEYRDPRTPGSLSGALRLWQGIRSGQLEPVVAQLRFAFLCSTEERAARVAGFLRRQHRWQTDGARPDTPFADDSWRVRGATPFALQSLDTIERCSACLARIARCHGVRLVSVTIAAPVPA